MSVHYKFKAGLDFSTVTFDGIHISVGDLKKEIIEQKRLGRNADFDLQIENAQTKEVYQDDFTLIPKNTSVVVARVPVSERKRSLSSGGGIGGGGARDGGRFAAMQRNHLASLPPADLAKGVDLATLDIEEEEKIKAMMCQATADYDPSRYMKIRGSNQHGRVPDSYRCYKCNNSGHWIKNCPMISHDSSDVKKSTGIPRSFMVMVDGPEPGALITPEGQYAVPTIDKEAYSTSSKSAPEPVSKPKIPEELICPLCQDLLTDALLVPCCANSYCDECIRTALTESDELVCPGCSEKDTSPNELIPNRFLRTAVNAFKNETGYSKPCKIPERKEKESRKEAQVAAAESRKISISLDELPEDLFPHSPRKIDPASSSSSSSSDQVDSTKADDGINSSDLYDFNDGSIPSPFSIQETVNLSSTSKQDYILPLLPIVRDKKPSEQISTTISNYHVPPPPLLQNQRSDYNGYKGPPPNYNRGLPPPHHLYGPPPPCYPRQGRNKEPSPPGFGDLAPPGEEKVELPPKMRQSNSSGPPSHQTPNSRDDRQEPHQQLRPGGPPLMIPGLPPFILPPPGYGPPPPVPLHRPPPIGGPGPAPGTFPPDQYPPPNFTRMPPPSGFPMYPMGPYPAMDIRHRDNKERDRDRERYRDRDHYDRVERDRGRGGSPRRSYHHRDDSDSGRLGGRRSTDDSRLGSIDDPLKEFEKLMREKDRRKLQMSGVLIKRSPTPPESLPPPRRNHSPNLRVRRSRSRSRGPSFTRAQSPSRSNHIVPVSKQRDSYYRSHSRRPLASQPVSLSSLPQRRNHSPSVPQKRRSRSRSQGPSFSRSQRPSFPRSQSPKRKRTVEAYPAVVKRRNSYSRSRSRSPGSQPVPLMSLPLHRNGSASSLRKRKSRSRSRGQSFPRSPSPKRIHTVPVLTRKNSRSRSPAPQPATHVSQTKRRSDSGDKKVKKKKHKKEKKKDKEEKKRVKEEKKDKEEKKRDKDKKKDKDEKKREKEEKKVKKRKKSKDK